MHVVTVEAPLGAKQVKIPLGDLPEAVRAALTRMTRARVIVPGLAEIPEELDTFFKRKGGKPLLGCIIYDDQGNQVALYALLLKGKYVESYIDAESEDAVKAAGIIVFAVTASALLGTGASSGKLRQVFNNLLVLRDFTAP